MLRMKYQAKSIRTFIGAKDFSESRAFYRELGFEDISVGPKMSYFKIDEHIGFYLQEYYVEDWVNNSMIFLEVDDLDACRLDLLERNLPDRYLKVRISKIQEEPWGRELFMHDPSGVLWHFGEFKTK